MKKRILILGATSAIAEQTARIWATEGHELLLCARDQAKLEILSKDLVVRGASSATTMKIDFTDQARHSEIFEWSGRVDIILVAFGVLSDQKECETNNTKAVAALEVNFLSTVSILTLAANRMEQERSGTIAVISSVAGDRGRQSNYVYGAAKAGLTAFLSGLRNRMYKHGVHIVTIKPGMVSTPMTAHLKQGILFTQSEKVANDIVRGIRAKKDVVYTPAYWRVIMAIIKILPEAVFKRLSL